MTPARTAWLKFFATRLFVASIDAATIAFAYIVAFILRFDFQEPSWGWGKVALSFVTVLAVYLLSLFVTGCYRLSWRRISVRELPRYILAMVFGCAVLTAMRYLLPDISLSHIHPP